ncbi:hypothetical protein WR25_11731 isoform B [Diploscapter pachys]|uniref:Uncharacterized protein n=1 Tax=Diploscapter pachys TaxID=2018661 RepID=A0A2A2KPJ8_9BILA|nr:hypothetical protein WR25_11731 isoform B [Diploscapter pachys]
MDPNSPSTSQMSNGSSSSVATMSPVGATPLPSPVATNGRSLFDQLIYNAATMRDSQISVHDFRDEMSAHLGPIDCVSDLELAYGALMAPMFDRLTAASQSIGLFQSAVAKTQAARAEKIVSQIKTLDEKSKKTKRKESEKDADGGPQTKVVKIASTPYHLYPNMNAPKQEMIIKCPNFRIGNIRAAIIEVLRVGGSRKCDITEAIRRTISAVLTQIIPFECKLKYTTASHCRKDCIPLPRTVLNGITGKSRIL